VQIKRDQVGLFSFRELKSCTPIAGGNHLIPSPTQIPAYEGQVIGIVINDGTFALSMGTGSAWRPVGSGSLERGSSKANVDPWPGVLETSI